MWLNLETVATAALGVLVFGEHLHRREWVAVALVVLAGVVLGSPEGFSLAPAALLVVAATTCWGLDNQLTSLIDGFTPEQSTLVKGVGAGVVNLGIATALGQAPPLGVALVGALAVGALGYGASIVLYIRGAQHLGATRSQTVFASAPFLGVAVAWGVLGEPILGVQVVAGLALVAGIALWSTTHHDHDHAHPGVDPATWHTHEHEHAAHVHRHPHRPDLHHRHDHLSGGGRIYDGSGGAGVRGPRR
jgi:drug/metabolite transporter (DMT)-like permease